MKKIDYSTTRYSRFVALPSIGELGIEKIRTARAAVVGAGGLGSVTATMLVALGIGYIRLFDNDVVELSNLQRQTLYRETDVGIPKVVAAKKFLNELNPDVEIEIVQEEIHAENVQQVSNNVDFVIDALDKFSPRFVLNKQCLEENLPFIFGAVSGLTGNAMTIIRGSTCIECLFGHVKDETLPSTAKIGIHPSIIQIIGNLQIAEATRIMLKEKPLLVNKLQFIDIGSMQFDTINVKYRKDCTNANYH